MTVLMPGSCLTRPCQRATRRLMRLSLMTLRRTRATPSMAPMFKTAALALTTPRYPLTRRRPPTAARHAVRPRLTTFSETASQSEAERAPATVLPPRRISTSATIRVRPNRAAWFIRSRPANFSFVVRRTSAPTTRRTSDCAKGLPSNQGLSSALQEALPRRAVCNVAIKDNPLITAVLSW